MGSKNQSKIFKMNFIVAQKQGPHGIILIVTDKDLIGHLFSEGNKQLDLTKEFYHGEEKNKEQEDDKGMPFKPVFYLNKTVRQ